LSNLIYMTTILGYEFENPALLEEALVTPSCKMENPDTADNQRLEFLGDAVLGLLAADRLYAELPKEQEGSLTVRRTHMVSAAALCEAAMRLGLRERLRRNKGAEALPPTSKTLADAVEAVIGAAYLDGGYEAARTVFRNLELSVGVQRPDWEVNPKGELQIRAQAMRPQRHPEYVLLKTSGKAHEPVFTVQVKVEGVGEAVAEARSHKEAEALAAARLLSHWK